MQRIAVRNGIDNLLSADKLLRGKRLGLATNPTGVGRELNSTADILRERYRLVALYGPEHGIRGDAQAGDKVGSTVDERTGLPMHSLYGASRHLTHETAASLDAMVFDMQDIGVRYFTYLYTLTNLMGDCAALGLPLIVLDRVNPLGGEQVQGNVLDERFASFVGKYAVPARYGLTIGEFARYINAEKGLGCDLTVVPCEGWRRGMYFDETDLPWVMPSPNMPTLESALCYPGTCLIEGTNLSEGRGTTKPFELIGAPWLNADDLAGRLAGEALPGVRFRPAHFRPTFSKHAGELCHGVQVHIVDRRVFDPFQAGITLLKIVREAKEFDWVQTDGRYFVDLLAGTDTLREKGFDGGACLRQNAVEAGEFRVKSRKYFLYPTASKE